MHPETFLRVLGKGAYRVAYIQPSRRPADGRYGENPNRLYKHTQLQVILKPAPTNVQEVYLDSLRAIGIDLREHDVRFEEDNWESPTLGAWGIGWQVLLDGLEITQFTYFQQCGGMDLDPVSVELTYGMERIAAFLQGVENVFDLRWSQDRTYGQVRLAEERQLSAYSFELADRHTIRKLLDDHWQEASTLLSKYGSEYRGGLSPWDIKQRTEWFPTIAAYEHCLKCSHLFNLLDSLGAISVTERASLIQRVRDLACLVAETYLKQMQADWSANRQLKVKK